MGQQAGHDHDSRNEVSMHWDFLRQDGWDLIEASFIDCPHSPSRMQGVFTSAAGIASERVSVPHFDRTERPGVKGSVGWIQPNRTILQDIPPLMRS
jgi:hypothetical protein